MGGRIDIVFSPDEFDPANRFTHEAATRLSMNLRSRTMHYHDADRATEYTLENSRMSIFVTALPDGQPSNTIKHHLTFREHRYMANLVGAPKVPANEIVKSRDFLAKLAKRYNAHADVYDVGPLSPTLRR